ncbi:MAG: YkgJ family cysteine cluster protein [Candidatus Parcubacteria bacterium]|nr:YkgJ family cysteine cluster protein [Candidatus Parcubacteria bacterium]
MEMKEKIGPCIDKNCSICCNPVKVRRFFPKEMIPGDTKGNKLWQKRRELLIPESQSEEVKIETYDCKNFDQKTGLCKDYEHRPDIRRKSGCVDINSSVPANEQFKKIQKRKFITIKP